MYIYLSLLVSINILILGKKENSIEVHLTTLYHTR